MQQAPPQQGPPQHSTATWHVVPMAPHAHVPFVQWSVRQSPSLVQGSPVPARAQEPGSPGMSKMQLPLQQSALLAQSWAGGAHAHAPLEHVTPQQSSIAEHAPPRAVHPHVP